MKKQFLFCFSIFLLLFCFVYTIFNAGCRKDWYCIKKPTLSVSQADAAGYDSGRGITIKTAFTPNGDGQNDMLLVTGTGSRLSITDNCNKKLFETTDATHQFWDGTFKGKKIKGICNYAVTDGSGNSLCSGKVQVVE